MEPNWSVRNKDKELFETPKVDDIHNSIRGTLDQEIKSIFEEEIHSASKELVEEYRLAIRKVVEERKSIIREQLEQIKVSIQANKENIKKSIAKYSIG